MSNGNFSENVLVKAVERDGKLRVITKEEFVILEKAKSDIGITQTLRNEVNVLRGQTKTLQNKLKEQEKIINDQVAELDLEHKNKNTILSHEVVPSPKAFVDSSFTNYDIEVKWQMANYWVNELGKNQTMELISESLAKTIGGIILTMIEPKLLIEKGLDNEVTHYKVKIPIAFVEGTYKEYSGDIKFSQGYTDLTPPKRLAKSVTIKNPETFELYSAAGGPSSTSSLGPPPINYTDYANFLNPNEPGSDRIKVYKTVKNWDEFDYSMNEYLKRKEEKLKDTKR